VKSAQAQYDLDRVPKVKMLLGRSNVSDTMLLYVPSPARRTVAFSRTVVHPVRLHERVFVREVGSEEGMP
jgi:hypothetical protein